MLAFNVFLAMFLAGSAFATPVPQDDQAAKESAGLEVQMLYTTNEAGERYIITTTAPAYPADKVEYVSSVKAKMASEEAARASDIANYPIDLKSLPECVQTCDAELWISTQSLADSGKYACEADDKDCWCGTVEFAEVYGKCMVDKCNGDLNALAAGSQYFCYDSFTIANIITPAVVSILGPTATLPGVYPPKYTSHVSSVLAKMASEEAARASDIANYPIDIKSLPECVQTCDAELWASTQSLADSTQGPCKADDKDCWCGDDAFAGIYAKCMVDKCNGDLNALAAGSQYFCYDSFTIANIITPAVVSILGPTATLPGVYPPKYTSHVSSVLAKMASEEAAAATATPEANGARIAAQVVNPTSSAKQVAAHASGLLLVAGAVLMAL